jgi:hypothetical protein
MALSHSPSIVTNSLVLCLDAANPKSYPGSGTTWTDLSGLGNNGTLVNGVGYTSVNRGSLVFDGVNDYVTLGNDKFKYQDNFTLEAWARFLSVPTNTGAQCGARHPIVYNHDYGYNLLVASTGVVEWYIYNTVSLNKVVTSLSSVVGSTYFHAVGIKSGTTISLYVNGTLQGSQNLTTNAVYYMRCVVSIDSMLQGIYRWLKYTTEPSQQQKLSKTSMHLKVVMASHK